MNNKYLHVSLWIALLIFGAQGSIHAQQESASLRKALYWTETADHHYQIMGYLDNHLPFELMLMQDDSLLMGFVYYGDNKDKYEVEGQISDTGEMTLYEFDHHQRASAIIMGNINNPKKDWRWNNMDKSNNMSLQFCDTLFSYGAVQVYHNVDKDNVESHCYIMRPDLNQLSNSLTRKQAPLAWKSYLCDGEYCHESMAFNRLANPIEFKNESESLLIYPDIELERESKAEIQWRQKSYHQYDEYIAMRWPVIGDDNFDRWVESQLQPVDESEFYSQSEDFWPVNERMNRFHFTDFYLTLLSEDLVSGFLYHYVSDDNAFRTQSFIYDRDKEKFYQLDDIFESGFDYSFYISQYTGRIKRGRLIKEPKVLRPLIRNSEYDHYVMTPEGLLFFTEHSTIFGRRSILVPYEDFESRIENKTLKNYLRKDR